MSAWPTAPLGASRFLRHEAKLAGRDMFALLTAQGRWPIRSVWIYGAAIVSIMHLIAWGLLADVLEKPIELDAKTRILAAMSLGLILCMILSQALESVTRLFYARGDLDLVMTAPIAAQRFFLPRITIFVGGCLATALPVSAPFLHILAVFDHPAWMAGYLVILLLAIMATMGATWIAFLMFDWFGPARTRFLAQIAAAVIGAAFLIGLQFAAIASTGTLSRMELLRLDGLQNAVPAADHLIWFPVWALRGDPIALLVLSTMTLFIVWLTQRQLAPQFGEIVLTAQSQTWKARTTQGPGNFEPGDPSRLLRHKEWRLLRRDPWLVSQSLMQILYLLPPAFLLFVHYGSNEDAAVAMCVAVLIMAMGQLAGGLSWLAISGEDARDLIETAPLEASIAVRAKIGAVMRLIGAISLPFVAAMSLFYPWSGLLVGIGIAVASICTIWLQTWFAGQASRRQFRRRQTTSRIAAFTEAIVSIGWAAVFAIAVQFPIMAIPLALFPTAVMVAASRLRP